MGLQVAVVSTVVNQAQVMPYIFRNYELPEGVPALYTGSSSHPLWEAPRASAAAPSYFEEFKTGDLLHQVITSACFFLWQIYVRTCY